MWYILVCAIFSYAALERFYRIKEIGINGSDVFFYFEMAKKYLAGNFEASEHFRPFGYLLYAGAMKVGGVNLYSIKMLNSFLDLLNMGVILLLSLKLIPNRWFALIPVFLYAMSMEPVWQARTELLHVPSTLPLLLACFFMMKVFDTWNRKQSYYFLFAAGFAYAFATNLHPSLNLLGPLFVITLFVFIINRTKGDHDLREGILRTACFCLGFFFVYMLAFSLIGFQDAIQVFLRNQSTQSKGGMNTVRNLAWAFENFVSGNSSVLMALLIYCCTILWITLKRPGRHHFFYTMTLILTVGYSILYALLVPRYQLVRTFLPLMPLLFILLTAIYYDFSKNVVWRKWLGVVALVLCVASLRSHARSWMVSVHQPVSIYYEVFQVLQGKFAPEDKLLVLPLISYHDRQPFAQPAYFGTSAHYAIENPAQNSNELLNPAVYRWIVLQKV